MMKRLFPLLWIVLAACGTTQIGRAKPQEPSGDLLVEHADMPKYPPLAGTARVHGIVKVRVTIRDHKVVHTRVLSGPPLLVPDTVENIRSWRFYRDTETTFTTEFVYELEEFAPPMSRGGRVDLNLPLRVKISIGGETVDF